MDEPKFPEVFVQLTGVDGNAFSILARVRQALIDAGYKNEAEQYMIEAMEGDYDHLLRVTMETVSVG